MVQEDGGFVAVLMEPTEHGFAQSSDRGDSCYDYIDAKRDAVDMAKRYGCIFVVPPHGQEI